jgi:FixJ family two-component response regulator
MNPMPIVHIVDNDALVVRATSRLLASEGFATHACTSTLEFLEHLDASVPGCVVLDLSMPDCNGLELQRRLLQQGVTLPVVFISGHGDVPSSVRAMKEGALDFLVKPVEAEALIAAVRRGVARDYETRARHDERRAIEARLATLTPREREVLPLLLTGRLNKQIAADFGIVEKTVKVHRARILHKFGVSSLAELVRLAALVDIRATRD